MSLVVKVIHHCGQLMSYRLFDQHDKKKNSAHLHDKRVMTNFMMECGQDMNKPEGFLTKE